MKAVIQRVSKAQVEIQNEIVSEINQGILTLIGIAKGDNEEKAKKILSKIHKLRIFPDKQGKMNQSLLDIQGEHLLVSQFTLIGDCSKGRRPSFFNAEEPQKAKLLYEKMLQFATEDKVCIRGGIFQADMQIHSTNDGPVTFLLEE